MIVVSNTGDCDLDNVTVVEKYNSTELEYVSHTNNAIWIKSGDVFKYSGVLVPGENATFTIVFKTLTNGTLNNTVVVSSNGTENKTTNNTTTVYKPDMAVEKIALNKTVYVGEQTVFTIVVRNTGDCDLGDVFVNEIIPEGLKFNSFAGENWSRNGNIFTYNGILKAGDSSSFNIIFDTVKNGNFTNVVIAGSDLTDNKTTNNITVVYCPDMSIQKLSNNKTVKVGEQVSFVIIVKNTGDCDLTGIYVIDNDYDEGLVYDHFSDESESWSYAGNGKWTYNKVLKVGQQASFTVIFNTTSVGFKVNNAIAGNNITNNKVNSSNVTNVTNNTIPKNDTPENHTHDIPEKDTPKKDSDVPKTQKDVKLDKAATGNPLIALLIVLMALGINPIRRRKK